MLSLKMVELGKKSSAIREIFEYGNARRAQIGAENVFDFSLGNPSIPAPRKVSDAMVKLIEGRSSVELHGYTSAPGDMGVRTKIAESIKERFGFQAAPQNIYMTCGAAASLTITLNALVNPGDEVIVMAPYFPEYKVFIEHAGAKVVAVMSREGDFQIDESALEKAVTPRTKAVIINSPNNPTGAVLSEDSIKALAHVLESKQKEYGISIYLIADEPYRELSYDMQVPYVPGFYDNTVVCYSYSKSLSLPGERIGYIFVSPKAESSLDLFAAVCGAGRAQGYVCAPSLMQYVIGECVYEASDIEAYRRNRDALYNGLREIGYSMVTPDGAFYIFMKSLEHDAAAFCERAKKYELLLVPSDSFGCTGYVRLAYCVSYDTIIRSLPAFRALYKEYEEKKI